MPYSSEAQRKFMYSQHPAIAKRWDKEGKNYIKGHKKAYSKDAIEYAKKLSK